VRPVARQAASPRSSHVLAASGSTLKLIDLSMHRARARQKHRIARGRSERFRAIGHSKRLRIFRA
jgi:hypothetical protein